MHDIYGRYDVVVRRFSQGLVVEHSRILNLPRVFKTEEEMVDRIYQSNPAANYIILEQING